MSLVAADAKAAAEAERGNEVNMVEDMQQMLAVLKGRNYHGLTRDRRTVCRRVPSDGPVCPIFSQHAIPVQRSAQVSLTIAAKAGNFAIQTIPRFIPHTNPTPPDQTDLTG